MANRPVYIPWNEAPFYKAVNTEFEWNGGFAKVQSQKNIRNLHGAFSRLYPGKKVLEISSKSFQEHGEELSAFFLQKYVPEIEKSVSVECVYQAAKAFADGGPYRDLLEAGSRKAKGDDRLKTSGPIQYFFFEGKKYPLQPRTAFYNFIYMNALLENPALAAVVLEYDGFTDIAFNPGKGVNCQAAAAAAFAALCKQGKIDEIKDFRKFLNLYGINFTGWEENSGSDDSRSRVLLQTEAVQAPGPEYMLTRNITAGCLVLHPKFGRGTVKSVGNGIFTVEFPSEGSKKIGTDWCLKNCTIWKKK